MDVDGPVLHVDPQEPLGVAEDLHVEAVHEGPLGDRVVLPGREGPELQPRELLELAVEAGHQLVGRVPEQGLAVPFLCLRPAKARRPEEDAELLLEAPGGAGRESEDGRRGLGQVGHGRRAVRAEGRRR